MSILAAPRYKKRISVDPQNNTWVKNENKFGQQLMQKMGWSAGNGLGSKNQGRTDNLKLDANFTAKGVGFTGNAHEKTWIAHHDEFSALLSKLKAQKVEPKKEESEDSESEFEEPVKKKAKITEISMEERSRNTAKRLHYKYTKMKDLSRYTAKDKAAVIGVGLNSIQKKPEFKPNVEEKSVLEPQQHQNTGVTVTDYFASKMAAFYAKRNTITTSNEAIESEAFDHTKSEEDAKLTVDKQLQLATELVEVKNDIPKVDEQAETQRLKRKVEKKARKLAKRAVAEAEEDRLQRKAEKKARKAAEREAAKAAEAKEELLQLKAKKRRRKCKVEVEKHLFC